MDVNAVVKWFSKSSNSDSFSCSWRSNAATYFGSMAAEDIVVAGVGVGVVLAVGVEVAVGQMAAGTVVYTYRSVRESVQSVRESVQSVRKSLQSVRE